MRSLRLALLSQHLNLGGHTDILKRWLLHVKLTGDRHVSSSYNRLGGSGAVAVHALRGRVMLVGLGAVVAGGLRQVLLVGLEKPQSHTLLKFVEHISRVSKKPIESKREAPEFILVLKPV